MPLEDSECHVKTSHWLLGNVYFWKPLHVAVKQVLNGYRNLAERGLTREYVDQPSFVRYSNHI